jgi:single-strand DNA-binding protein
MAGDVYVTVVGNLSDDPEMRFTPNGAAVAKLRMASTPRKRLDSGEWADMEPSWYRVTCWRQLAENAVETFGKGDRVIVYGRLTIRAWRKDGEDFDRYSAEIDAEYVGAELTFRPAKIGPKPGGGTREKVRREDPFETATAERPAQAAQATTTTTAKVDPAGQSPASPAEDW